MARIPLSGALFLLSLFVCPSLVFASNDSVFRVKPVFNVKDYGATGNKTDDAEPALQKALDAASAAGGGTVYLPPGSYTSGTLNLRSHVNLYLEAGATLYASKDWHAFDKQKVASKDALLFGDGLEDISIGGRGTVDGQETYIWLPDTIKRSWEHKVIMDRLGKPEMHPYPEGYPSRTVDPHLLWLGDCKNVRISGLSFLHSPSWTFALYHCSRVVVDGIYIYTSLEEGVWADGIDIVSSNDVSISNSTIATGDDCIALVGGIPEWGPVTPLENITITNCRFSSASAAIKFTEGNRLLVQHVLVSNCVIFDANRGITLEIADGGTINDVVMSNIVINVHRFPWLWEGDGNAFNFEVKRASEWNGQPRKPGEPGPGLIHNVILRDMIVHSQGTSRIQGHPERYLEGVTFENIKFFLSSDPSSPYDTSDHALVFRWAKNLTLRNIEVHWEKPAYDKWQSALDVEDVDGLTIDGFTGNSAWPDRKIPALVLNRVTDATVRDAVAPESTNIFLKIAGSGTHNVQVLGNDFHEAKVPYVLAPEVKADGVQFLNNFLPSK